MWQAEITVKSGVWGKPEALDPNPVFHSPGHQNWEGRVVRDTAQVTRPRSWNPIPRSQAIDKELYKHAFSWMKPWAKGIVFTEFSNLFQSHSHHGMAGRFLRRQDSGWQVILLPELLTGAAATSQAILLRMTLSPAGPVPHHTALLQSRPCCLTVVTCNRCEQAVRGPYQHSVTMKKICRFNKLTPWKIIFHPFQVTVFQTQLDFIQLRSKQ